MVSISVRYVGNYNLQIAQYSHYKMDEGEVSSIKINNILLLIKNAAAIMIFISRVKGKLSC